MFSLTANSMARARAPWHKRFNLEALLTHATSLRKLQCSCDLNQIPMAGSSNYAILLKFEDNVEWIFRYPMRGEGHMSLKVAGELLTSEVATMKYVTEHTSVPVPEIFDYRSVNRPSAPCRITDIEKLYRRKSNPDPLHLDEQS